MQQIPIYFKSDFKLFIRTEAGFAVPFKFEFYTNMPSRPYIVKYDGHKYHNCELLEDGRLCIAFDDHGFGLGKLMIRQSYYLNDADYASEICDRVIAPQPVVNIDDNLLRSEIVLALSGDDTIEFTSQLPPYYQAGLTPEEHQALIDATVHAEEAAASANEQAGIATEAAKAADEARQALTTAYNEKVAALDADYAQKKSALEADYAGVKNALSSDYDSVKAQLDADYAATKEALATDYATALAGLNDRMTAIESQFSADREAWNQAVSSFITASQATFDGKLTDWQSQVDAAIADITRLQEKDVEQDQKLSELETFVGKEGTEIATTWYQGGLNSSDGQRVNSDIRIASDYIEKSNVSKVTCGNSQDFIIYNYDSSKRYIDYGSYITSYIGDGGSGYIRIHLRNKDNSNITITDATVVIEGKGQSKNIPTQFKEVRAEIASIESIIKYASNLTLIGDSISTYEGYLPVGYVSYYPNTTQGVTDVKQTWWHIVKEKFALTVQNLSYSGSCASKYDTRPSLYDRVQLINSNTDVVIIALGTNDSYRNVPIGELDFSKSLSEYDETKFTEAYIKGIKYILNNTPSAKIILLVFSLGSEQYANAIKAIAEHYELKVVDCRSFYNDTDSDGVHPSATEMISIADGFVSACTISIEGVDVLVDKIKRIEQDLYTENRTENREDITPTFFVSNKMIVADRGNENFGKEYEAAGVKCTDYINITKYSKIECSIVHSQNASSTGGLCFYTDKSTSSAFKGILYAGVDVKSNKVEILDIPSGAKYVRFSIYSDESFGSAHLTGLYGGGKELNVVRKDDIVDNLTQGGKDKVLSAEQGKELLSKLWNTSKPLAKNWGWEIGGLGTNDGYPVDSDVRIRTISYIPNNGGRISVNNDADLEFFIFYYNEKYGKSAASSGYYQNYELDSRYAYFKLIARKKSAPTTAINTEIGNNICMAEDVTSQTKLIPMIGGAIDKNGNMKCARKNRADYANYLSTPLFVPCSKLIGVKLEAGEDCVINYYDANLTLIKSSSAVGDTPKSTSYIKIMLHKDSEYDVIRTLEIYVEGADSEFLRNDGRVAEPNFFSFETQVPYIDVNSSADDIQLTNKRHYDNGYVMLPPNYSQKGQPVPLVIFVHGTTGYEFAETDIVGKYKPYLQYICNCGYAVADCSGMTDKYALEEPVIVSGKKCDDCKLTPVGFNSFANLYKYITKMYNVKDDGAYVFGKSAGGFYSTMLGYLQPFKVKAVGGLAPSVSFLGAEIRWETDYDMKHIMNQFGVDDIFGTWITWNHDVDFPKVLANIDKISPYDPFLKNTDLDAVAITTAMHNHGQFDMDKPDVWEIVNVAHKNQPFPYKIWGAPDDAATPYPVWKMWKKMVDNAHGLCFLRTMPSGTGGHNSVDSHTNALKVTVKPKYSDQTVTVPLAYAELVEWFDRY